MILDIQTTLAGTTAVDGTKTAQGPITATQISAHVIDLRNSAIPALVDEGIHGDDVWLEVRVVQAFGSFRSERLFSCGADLDGPRAQRNGRFSVTGVTQSQRRSHR